MKVEWRIFVGGAVVIGLTAAVYWFVTSEYAGTTMLTLMAGAMVAVGAWLALQARRLDRPLPQDRDDATVADGAGEVGFFPTSSIWPFVGAGGAVVLGVGLVFGVWLSLLGGILLVVTTVGYAAEAHSGGSGPRDPPG